MSDLADLIVFLDAMEFGTHLNQMVPPPITSRRVRLR